MDIDLLCIYFNDKPFFKKLRLDKESRETQDKFFQAMELEELSEGEFVL